MGRMHKRFHTESSKLRMGIFGGIRNKLIFFFLLVSIVPIILIGALSYVTSRRDMVQKIQEYSIGEINQAVAHMQLKLKEFENIGTQLFINKDFNRATTEYIKNVKGGSEARRDILSYFNSYMITYPDIFAFMFIGADQLSDPVIVTKDYQEQFKEYSIKTKESDFYQEIITAGGGNVWSPPVKLEGGNFIILGRYLKNEVTKEPLGILAIVLDEEKIDRIINSHIYNDLNIEFDNIKKYSLIIDSNGDIVSTMFKEDIGSNISNILTNTDPLTEVLSGVVSDRDYGSEMNQGTFIDSEKDVLVTYKSISAKVVGGYSGWHLLSLVKMSYLYAEANAVGFTTLILGLIFAMIAIVISISVAYSISNPLNKVVKAMRQAEEGEIGVRVRIKSGNELGQLGASFNRMLEKISILIIDTKQAIDAVLNRSSDLEESSHESAQTAVHVAAAMTEITKGTVAQTQEAENSVQQMYDLARQIDTMVDQANEVEKITSITKDLSIKSKGVVKLLIDKTGETDRITKIIVNDINALRCSAEEIHNITDLITNLADQTNLLALNAAIEAARAGEMGQGFAVVAEEVNKLAVQSRDAAKTINSILQTIQEKTTLSTDAVEKANLIVGEQLVAVHSAQKSFDEIIIEMDEAVSKIINMNEGIKQINVLKERTVQAMANISAISEETAASAEQVSASAQEQTSGAEQVKLMAQELRRMAASLVEVIAKFNIEKNA